MIELALVISVFAASLPAEPLSPAPASVTVATARGQAVVPVSAVRGHPALPVPQLRALLPLTAELQGEWVLVAFADQPFRFLLDAPAFTFRGTVFPLVGGAYVANDTTYLPLQWLSNHIPRLFSEGYRYDPYAARFEEARLAPVVADARASPPTPPRYRVPDSGSAAERNGFRIQHAVVVDAGHGGSDPGNPGRYLPMGVNEKHVTLTIARRLRDELERRGVEVVMTRTRDTLVALGDRARMCSDYCDVFVSIHVNSLRRSPGYERANGLETYFLSEARTAEAARVAEMENEALRYEPAGDLDESDPLAFILRDLQANEYLRESAVLADLVQEYGARVHPGRNRGVSQALFAVLRSARRPAIIIETGFATNREDARFLSSSSGQQRLAEAIAEGIVRYLRQYEDKVLAGLEG